jgi:ribosomal protein L7/L12
MPMLTATLIRCTQCQAVARFDRSQTTNPVQLGSNPRAPNKPPAITRCTQCRGYYWIEDAKAVAELPLHRAGAPLADVILVAAGDNLAAVLTALNQTDRWSNREAPKSLPGLPWTIVDDVSLETAEGLSSAYEELGATVEVRPHERDPRWDSAPHVRHLTGDEWDEAIEAGCGTDAERLAHLNEGGGA